MNAVRASLLVVVVAAVVSGAACTRPVCGGRGMGVDPRPLQGVLADVGLPPGATQCDVVVRPSPDAWAADHRNVELGKTAFEGVALWQQQLASKGWRETTSLQRLADNGVIEAAAQAGHPLSSCSVRHEFSKDGVAGHIFVGAAFCQNGWDEAGWTEVSYIK